MAGPITRAGRITGLLLAVMFTLVAIAAPGAYASAKPIKGALYETVSSELLLNVSFVVSANGKSLSHVEVTGDGLECPLAKFQFPTHSKVSGHKFTLRALGFEKQSGKEETVKPPPTPLKKGEGATIKGTFGSGGGASGSYTASAVCRNYFVTPVVESTRHYKDKFASTARPQGAGSYYCPDHTAGKGGMANTIIAEAVSCAKVDEALEAGTFGKAEEHAVLRAFTTPGWTCTNEGGYKCSMPPPSKARFSFNGEPPHEPQPTY